MARGNANRGMRTNNQNQNNNIINKQKECSNVQAVQNVQDAIDRHWESMPPQAKKFILETLDFLSIHRLTKFWSSPGVVEYTRGGIAGSVCGASWFIALNYLKLGRMSEARALTLNGSFLHQCYVSISVAILFSCTDLISFISLFFLIASYRTYPLKS